MLQDEIALGNSTGFIHNYGGNILQSLHSYAALEQNAVFGACADTAEEGQRHAQHQSAGTTDYQEGQSGVNPFFPFAGHQRRNNSGRHSGSHNERRINPRKAGNEAIDSRFGGSGVFHAVQDARYHGFCQNFFHADFQHAARVDAAGNNFVAISTLHRYGFTRYGGSIYQAFAFDNHAVQRDAVAHAHQQNVAHMRVLSGNNLHFLAYQQVDNLRTHINGVHNLAAAFFYSTLLEIFAHAVEEHYAYSLFPRLDSERAQRSDSHQKVFVKNIALGDIFQRGQHDAPAQQNIRENQAVHMISFRNQPQPFCNDENRTAQNNFD